MLNSYDTPEYILRGVYCHLRDELFNATSHQDIENVDAALKIVLDLYNEVVHELYTSYRHVSVR